MEKREGDQQSGRRSEKWDATPLTFLTIFCKAGKGRGETKAEEGREVRGDMRAAFVVNVKHSTLKIARKHKQAGFIFVLLSMFYTEMRDRKDSKQKCVLTVPVSRER